MPGTATILRRGAALLGRLVLDGAIGTVIGTLVGCAVIVVNGNSTGQALGKNIGQALAGEADGGLCTLEALAGLGALAGGGGGLVHILLLVERKGR
jgi:hypothetical protein